jgi:hypothetical protein
MKLKKEPREAPSQWKRALLRVNSKNPIRRSSGRDIKTDEREKIEGREISALLARFTTCTPRFRTSSSLSTHVNKPGSIITTDDIFFPSIEKEETRRAPIGMRET